MEQVVEEEGAARKGLYWRAWARPGGGRTLQVEEVVLAHVKVLEALDTRMVDGHEFLNETQVHFTLLDVE